jgi:hypothetical protein
VTAEAIVASRGGLTAAAWHAGPAGRHDTSTGNEDARVEAIHARSSSVLASRIRAA